MTSGRSYLRRARKRGPRSRRAGSLGTYDARRGALADAPPRRGRALDPPRAELNPNFALAQRPSWYAARHPTGTRGSRCERPACAEVEPERSACPRLRLIRHGGCSFRRRALCGLRGPRAGHSRYPPRPWPFTTFSSRRRRCRGIGQRRAAALTSLLRLEPDFSLKWLSENMA